MRIVIYSKGRLFQRYKTRINWDEVVAVVDKKVEPQEMINDKPVVMPQKICSLHYDYIVIFSDKYFYAIRRELIGEYFVEPDKIVSWRFLIKDDIEAEAFFTFKMFIRTLDVHSVLDLDMTLIPRYVFSKEEIISNPDFILEGVGSQTYPYYKRIYRKIYSRAEMVGSIYDLIYINHTWTFDATMLINSLESKWKRVLLRVPYDGYEQEKQKKLLLCLEKYADVKSFFLVDGVYFLLSQKEQVCVDLDVQIYVVTHRDYNVMQDELYRPICVGGHYHKEGYLSEQQGENISYLNGKINECTAMYWIWKNTSSEYVGLNHYRRYFYNDGILSENNYLNKQTILHIFQQYDMILPEYRCFYNVSVEEQMRMTMEKDAFEKGYETVRTAMAVHQPGYLDAFEAVMQGHKLFICNMFVMSRDIFNEYCEWLFSFLIEAAENIDVEMYDNYSRRVIGFFAERMLTVWLMKHDFKIKELPIDNWT